MNDQASSARTTSDMTSSIIIITVVNSQSMEKLKQQFKIVIHDYKPLVEVPLKITLFCVKSFCKIRTDCFSIQNVDH